MADTLARLPQLVGGKEERNYDEEAYIFIFFKI